MKEKYIFSTVGLLSLAIFLLSFVNVVGAAETGQVAKEHLALAKSYEEKAAVQDALIAEHTQMKTDYKQRFFVNEKVTPMEKIRSMENHCNAIIAAAQNEKRQLLEFAKWHQMRAAELQGL